MPVPRAPHVVLQLVLFTLFWCNNYSWLASSALNDGSSLCTQVQTATVSLSCGAQSALCVSCTCTELPWLCMHGTAQLGSTNIRSAQHSQEVSPTSCTCKGDSLGLSCVLRRGLQSFQHAGLPEKVCGGNPKVLQVSWVYTP